jgi:hypothetical protein
MAAPAPVEEDGGIGRWGNGETFAKGENFFFVSFSTPLISPNSFQNLKSKIG